MHKVSNSFSNMKNSQLCTQKKGLKTITHKNAANDWTNLLFRWRPSILLIWAPRDSWNTRAYETELICPFSAALAVRFCPGALVMCCPPRIWTVETLSDWPVVTVHRCVQSFPEIYAPNRDSDTVQCRWPTGNVSWPRREQCFVPHSPGTKVSFAFCTIVWRKC